MDLLPIDVLICQH